MKGKLLKIFAGVLAIVVLGICVQIFLSSSLDRRDVRANNLTPLSNPFLALAAEPQLPGTTFLEKEAGISGYTNVGKDIDLDKARAAFKTVEKETDEYIIGSVKTTGKESDDAHCYIHKDGWVMLYYSKDSPIAKIIYWGNLRATKLEKGMSDLCTVAGMSLGEVKYYDFRYQDAERLMVIIGTGDFKLNIPSSYTVYERSFSLEAGGGQYRRILIDNINVASASGSYWGESENGYETLMYNQLEPDIFHTIRAERYYGPGSSWIAEYACAIVLAYREG